MKYFRDTNTGEVSAYEADGSQDKYIKPGLVRLTDAEVQAHLNPPAAPLTLEQAQELRRLAYIAESDPMKNEAEYDALLHGAEPDYTAWMKAVAEIKARYPLPE